MRSKWRDAWTTAWTYRRYWLTPLAIGAMIFLGLFLLAGATGVMPFVYAF